MNAPLDVRSGTQAAFAAALIDPDQPLPPGLYTHNGSDPARRFAVYQNNVLHSLVSALKATFPVTAELVGDEFFGAMAAVHARATPPRSRRMSRYGEAFADFIRGFPPAASVPYLADVANLEAARLAVYHAADDAPLSTETLTSRLKEAGLALRVRLVDAHRVLRSAYAIHSLFAAHQGALAIETVDPFRAEAVLVHRVDDDVMTTRLADGDAVLLDALARGAPLGEAATEALAADPALSLPHALAALIEAGLVAETLEG